MARIFGLPGSAQVFGHPGGDIPVFRTKPAPEPTDDGKHQPVNTALEQKQRREYYRDHGQGIRGGGTR